MTGEVVGNMSLFLGYLSMCCLERIVLLNSIELVSVLASDQYDVVVLVVE